MLEKIECQQESTFLRLLDHFMHLDFAEEGLQEFTVHNFSSKVKINPNKEIIQTMARVMNKITKLHVTYMSDLKL